MTDAKEGKKGTVPRRVLMPIGMWTEVMEISRLGGFDHQDTLVELIDLGLQAQSEERFKPRVVALDSRIMERVAAMAREVSRSEDETLVRLVDIGLQAKAVELSRPEVEVDPVQGVPTRIESGGRLLCRQTFWGSVPAAGEVVTVNGKPYVIEQRAWAVAGGRTHAYLRVKPYPGD